MAIVLLFLVTLTFIFAYAVHAAELHAPDEDGEEVRDLGDAVWLVLISMTTVGFGEVVPHTAAGKAFAAAATIIGMLLTAIVISVVHSQLALTYQQAYALKALQRDVLLKKEVTTAQRYIVTSWRFYTCVRRLRASPAAAAAAAPAGARPRVAFEAPGDGGGRDGGGGDGGGLRLLIRRVSGRRRVADMAAAARASSRGGDVRGWGQASVPAAARALMALAMDAKKSYKLARAKRIACELSVTDPGTHVLASLQANVKVIEAAQLDQVNLMCNLKNLLPRRFPEQELGEYSEAVDALGDLGSRVASVEERLQRLDMLTRQITARLRKGGGGGGSPGKAPDEGGGGGGGGGHTSAEASAEAAERDDERDLNRDSPTTDLQLQDVEQDVGGSLQVEYDANGRRRVR